MEKIQLKIGTNIGTEKIQYEVPAEIPSTWTEVQSLDIPAEVKTDCFNRGWRIKLQEQSGARDYLAETTPEQRKTENKATMIAKLSEIIGQFISDPTAKKAGRPRQPQEVVIPQGAMSKNALAEMTKALEAQGIKVTLK